MARLPYLPVWVGDFMADTQQLDCRESGALLLLLFAAWVSPDGGLPDDDRILARLARCGLGEWRRLRPAVLDFWHRGDDGSWHQKRLDEERRQAEDKTAAARSSARARWLKNKETGDASALPAQCGRNAHQTHTHTHNHKDHEGDAPGARAPDGARPRTRPAGLAREPLILSGVDGVWKLRLLGHRPGQAWSPAFGPPPESGEDNPRLDGEQRRQWRRHFGLAADWRSPP